ncbi:MAG: hypothetical protein ACYCSG_05310 [Thermoplasmataceae archaeon]
MRPLREELKTLKISGKIDPKAYRKYYRVIKGGSIRSRAQLRTQLKSAGVLGEGK